MTSTNKKYIYLAGFIGLIILLVVVLTTSPRQSSIPLPSNIDLVIKPSTGPYNFENTNNKFATYFKSNPVTAEAIKFSNALASIAFFTAPAQAFAQAAEVKPTITNNAITYPNLFPQTDLKYSLSPTRLLEEFVVKDKQTALNTTTIIQNATTVNVDRYQEEADGSISFYSKESTAFIIPKPVMYEQGNQDIKSYGIKYEVNKVSANEYAINKVITDEGIRWFNDPTRKYPIIIDLVIDNADTDTDWVSSDATNTTVSGETSIKHEGTGSVKVVTTADSSNTFDLMEYSSDANAQTAYVTNAIIASGGTETTSGVYRIHTFTSNGTFSVTNGGNVQVLAVAGGGGGAGGALVHGGGGGGGMVSNSSFAISSGNISVTVGGGGTAGSGGAAGGTGGNSVFSTITAYGGGGGVVPTNNGSNGGCGGGGAGWNGSVVSGGTGSQGYNGGGVDVGDYAGGGGGGAGAVGGTGIDWQAGAGGAGASSSISGATTYYAGGGGGSGRGGLHGVGGIGGGGDGGASAGTNGLGGGGGGGAQSATGYAGGSGVVIVSYPDLTLQSYSEATIKTQGTYSLKNVAKATNSLNKTLTRTIGSPIDLSNKNSVTFDIRSTRTGSNIKVGLHDSGGTTTEVTPNIASANTFQEATIDLSGVSNANKDAIDQIIITIVNADADNTFYIDDMTSLSTPTLNDTITLTKTATDLSSYNSISFWIRSNTTGQTLRFQFGEAASDEQTYDITINAADTWEQKIMDISEISASAKDAVTKLAFKITNSTAGQTFYFDELTTPNPVARMSGVTLTGVIVNGPLPMTASPGTMADDATVGTKEWTDPNNAKVNDANPATASDDMDAPWTSHYLKASNFGFTIPTGSTINGIKVEIEERDASGMNGITDSTVKIIKADGTLGSENKAKIALWAGVTTYTEYGSSTDLWSETWTTTDINDSDFGVVLSVSNTEYFSAAQVDHIRITVYYTQ